MDTLEPLVSIIIPTYNRVKYLPFAVESCISQTYGNIEVIIVDDGSTDGTEVFVSKLVNDLPSGREVKYVKQVNSGASRARNCGLSLSTGEYIQFLDSDDVILEDKIAKQVKAMLKYDADVCTCFGTMGTSMLSLVTKLGVKYSTKDDLIEKLCSGVVHVLPTLSPLWKKVFVINSGGWNSGISLGDDLEFHIRTLISVDNVICLPDNLFFVRTHEGPRISEFSNDLSKIQSNFDTQRIIYELLNEHRLWNSSHQKGLIRVGRSLYAHFLLSSDLDKIRYFEEWFCLLCKNPKVKWDMLIFIKVRQMFGLSLFIRLYKIFKRNG